MLSAEHWNNDDWLKPIPFIYVNVGIETLVSSDALTADGINIHSSPTFLPKLKSVTKLADHVSIEILKAFG